MTKQSRSTGNESTLPFLGEPAFDLVAEHNRQLLVDAVIRMEQDFEAFWNIFDKDVAFYVSPQMPYGGIYRGREATREAFLKIAARYSRISTTIEAALASRDLCILYQIIDFEVRANKNTGIMPVAEVYRFREGKVIEWRVLYSDADFLAKSLTGS